VLSQHLPRLFEPAPLSAVPSDVSPAAPTAVSRDADISAKRSSAIGPLTCLGSEQPPSAGSAKVPGEMHCQERALCRW
jgi:hypothetical protein